MVKLTSHCYGPLSRCRYFGGRKSIIQTRYLLRILSLILTGILVSIPQIGSAEGRSKTGTNIVFPLEFVPAARRTSSPDPDITPKIVQGFYVQPGEFTFQVALIAGGTAPGEEFNTQFCGVR